jgi:hypothetical protein
MRRSLVGAAGVLAALLVLAGCGGDPKADPSPSPSTPSVSTTPSPTAPVMPAAASENTKAGAIAFVRYYIELINHAQATGDVAALESVESAGCESCAKVRTSIAKIYASGGSITGGSWHPHLRTALQNDDGSWLVSGYIQFDPEQVKRSRESPIESAAGGSAITHVTVVLNNDIWKVLKWSRES